MSAQKWTLQYAEPAGILATWAAQVNARTTPESPAAAPPRGPEHALFRGLKHYKWGMDERGGMGGGSADAASCAGPGIRTVASAGALPADCLIGLSMVYHVLGRKAESDAALAELTRKYPRDGAYNIASVYAFRGESDRAFQWLDRAVEVQDPGLSQIAVDAPFAPIRFDPRWLPFLRRVGKAPEQLARISFHVSIPSNSAAPAPVTD